MGDKVLPVAERGAVDEHPNSSHHSISTDSPSKPNPASPAVPSPPKKNPPLRTVPRGRAPSLRLRKRLRASMAANPGDMDMSDVQNNDVAHPGNTVKSSSGEQVATNDSPSPASTSLLSLSSPDSSGIVPPSVSIGNTIPHPSGEPDSVTALVVMHTPSGENLVRPSVSLSESQDSAATTEADSATENTAAPDTALNELALAPISVTDNASAPPTAPGDAVRTPVPSTSVYHKIVKTCDREGILWTKMKGHPYWPAQIVNLDSDLMLESRFMNAQRSKYRTDDVCVMFFGTIQVAWTSKAKSTISWKQGLDKGLHQVLPHRAAYQAALSQVLSFCAKQRMYPHKWWCEPSCMAHASTLLKIWAHPNFRHKFSAELKLAEAECVCWVKLRGHPHWPAQIIPDEHAKQFFPNFLTPKEPRTSWPCIFFGTGDVAIARDGTITPWVTGIADNYIELCHRYDFLVALGEAWGYVQRNRTWPAGLLSGRRWWNDPGKISEPLPQLEPMMDVPDRPKYDTIRRSVYPPHVARPKTSPGKVVAICGCNPMTNDVPDTLYCRDSACLNVASRFWCDPKLCPAGERCANGPFFKRKPKRLTPFYTTDDRGWGLRIDEDISRGEFIIGYVGEILDKKEKDWRQKEAQKQGKFEYYVMSIGKDQFVDAGRRGNLARFINSSCAPNCDAQKWVEPGTGQTHVGIFALEDISAGVELTFNYFNDSGWAEMRQDRSFVCRCGTDTCFMIEPEDRNWVAQTIGKRVNVKWDDGWYIGTVHSYNLDEKKFKIHYDDGDIEEIPLLPPGAAAAGNIGVPFKFVKAK